MANAETSHDWLAVAASTLRARIWLVALLVAAGLGVAVAYLRTADYTYGAAMRVAPAPTSARETGGLGALGNLASLTGVAIEAAPATPFRLYVEGINSREVATRLADDPALLRGAFASEWDARTRTWVPPTGFGLDVRNGLYALVGAPVPKWSPPDAVRLQAWIAARVYVDQTPKTPIVTIGMDTGDRAFGVAFLGSLHAATDRWLREKTLSRTRQNIAYLNSRLPIVAAAEHRQALFATLDDQEQRLMTARNPAAFAAESFGAVTVSATPTRPRQLPILVLGLAAGLVLGVALALVVPRAGGSGAA